VGYNIILEMAGDGGAASGNNSTDTHELTAILEETYIVPSQATKLNAILEPAPPRVNMVYSTLSARGKVWKSCYFLPLVMTLMLLLGATRTAALEPVEMERSVSENQEMALLIQEMKQLKQEITTLQQKSAILSGAVGAVTKEMEQQKEEVKIISGAMGTATRDMTQHKQEVHDKSGAMSKYIPQIAKQKREVVVLSGAMEAFKQDMTLLHSTCGCSSMYHGLASRA
jgi:hypothetical protein